MASGLNSGAFGAPLAGSVHKPRKSPFGIFCLLNRNSEVKNSFSSSENPMSDLNRWQQNSSRKIGCFPNAKAQYIEEEDENDFKFGVQVKIVSPTLCARIHSATPELLHHYPPTIRRTILSELVSEVRTSPTLEPLRSTMMRSLT
jgi:hypothetical protein